MTGQLEQVLGALDNVKRCNGYWMASCPAHDDQNPSLSVTQGKTQPVVFHCQAGCSQEEVVAALLRNPQLRYTSEWQPEEDVYSYVDENGDVLFQVVRMPGKTFFQRRWNPQLSQWEYKLGDVRRVLYRLPDVIRAVEDGEPVFVVEGENDADRLAREGRVATTNSSGAGKWKDEYSPFLSGADVVILPDNDKPGEQHAQQVAASLDGVAARVRILRLPDLGHKGDVSDWLDGGGTVAELSRMAKDLLEKAEDGDDLPLLTLDDLRDRPKHEYLIDGFVVARDLTMLYGPSGSGKTFAGLGMGLSVASGVEWLGRQVAQGPVLYVAGEGASGLLGRVEAWKTAHGVHREPDIRFWVEPIDLRRSGDVDGLIRAAGTLSPVLIVFDPLSRMMEGADENSSKDMGLALHALDRIGLETGAAVLLLHHTGKDHHRGPRGHSALQAAVGLSIRVTKTDRHETLMVDKNREAESGLSVNGELRSVNGSAVLVVSDRRSDGTPTPALGFNQEQLLRTLASFGGGGATHTAWLNEAGYQKRKASFNAARKALVTRDLVAGGGGRGQPYRLTDAAQELLGTGQVQSV